MTLPTLAVVGPTGSGKSALAMALAETLAVDNVGVELLSVDSMQVYRGMDIGTAKPTAADRAAVPHHLLDLLDPSASCSVSWFQGRAKAALADVIARSKTAVLVGGTGLYHRAVIDELEIPGQWPEVVDGLEREADTARLHRRLCKLDPLGASRMEPSNRRRVVRALEVTIGSGRPFSSFGPGLEDYRRGDVVQVGLMVGRTEIRPLLERRLDRQVERGFLDEVRRLHTRAEGMSRTASQALGYRELWAHIDGERTLSDALQEILVRTRRFAVRQQRWFRRDPRVAWFDAERPDLGDAVLDHWRNSGRNPRTASLG